MKQRRLPLIGMACATFVVVASPLCAQQGTQTATARPAAATSAAAAIDPATIPMPELAFTPDPETERNYFKYFYFHRDDTDFATAYGDLQECDGYARGLAYRASNSNYYQPYPYTYAGAIGGAIGSAIGNIMADAIFGSAERRRQRRVNMRTCMGFKGYSAYGLPRDTWRAFNFDEGNGQVENERRDTYLRQQARVASGPHPTRGEMPQ